MNYVSIIVDTHTCIKNADTDATGSMQKRCFCFAKTRVQELTRMSASAPSWMTVVPCSNKFVQQTCSERMYMEVHSFALRERLQR